MDQLVSVIVPVYKVEDFLSPCVDSILSQTYRHLEIILVDDGSPDSCGRICDDYGASDSRIKVIHKKNGGLSDARNAGMEIATGSFLMFVDSDDLLPPNAVETLLSLALEHDAQLVIGGHSRFETTPTAQQEGSQPPQIFTPIQAMEDMFLDGCAAWARIYRKEIHRSIPYPVGRINEDEAIVLKILENCTTVVKTDTIVYHYRCRPNSITTSQFSQKQLHWIEHCQRNLEYAQKHYPQLELVAAARYRSSILWVLSEMALSEKDFRLEIQRLRRDLRKHKQLFRKAYFPFKQDRIRMEILLLFPFGFYKFFLRIKRGR